MAKDCNGKEIKVGDKVVRTTSGYAGVVPGGTYVVRKAFASDSIALEGFGNDFTSENFVLVESQPMPEKVRDPHTHAEVAKAWLDGYPVEVWSGSKWTPYCRNANSYYVPGFSPEDKYRIQPAETEKEKQIKQLVRQAEELLAKAKELEATK